MQYCWSCLMLGLESAATGWLSPSFWASLAWSLPNPNDPNRDFSLLLSGVGTKLVCWWESPRTQRLCTLCRMLMLHEGPGPLTPNCANGGNIALQANSWNLRSKSLVLARGDPLASGRSAHSHHLLGFSVGSECLTSSPPWCQTELSQQAAAPAHYSARFWLSD